jgi:hypothetical protein
VIVNRLLAQKSALLIKGEDGALEFAANAKSAPLPTDFISLAARPYLAGATPLAPLGGQSGALLNTAGTPLYFDIAGRTLRLYPPAQSAVTVCVPYFFRPQILTEMTDTLPFWGEFDSVFVEGCVGVMAQGLTLVANREFVAVIQSQVDAVLRDKELIDEQILADAINER